MSSPNLELIKDYFPDISAEKLATIHQAALEYIDWNSKVNVVSRKDMDYIIERHFLHSLAIAKHSNFSKGTKVLDLGTGGGFPGIPLAIYFPDVEFTLVDSIGKKIKVIDSIVESVGLKNVITKNNRVEELKGSYDFIVSRAVAPIKTIVYWTSHLLSKKNSNNLHNGYIFLKGGDLKDEIKESKLRCKEIPLTTYFNRPFFETKKIIYASSGK